MRAGRARVHTGPVTGGPEDGTDPARCEPPPRAGDAVLYVPARSDAGSFLDAARDPVTNAVGPRSIALHAEELGLCRRSWVSVERVLQAVCADPDRGCATVDEMLRFLYVSRNAQNVEYNYDTDIAVDFFAADTKM